MERIDNRPDDGVTSSDVEVDETRSSNGAIVLTLSGELDISSVDAVHADVEEAIAQAPTVLVFEMSGLDFMDSSGLALLLGAVPRVARLEIRNPSENVRRIIEITGLSSMLPITP